MSVYGGFRAVFGKRNNLYAIRCDTVECRLAEYRGERSAELGINTRCKIDYILYAVVFKNLDASYSQLIRRESDIVAKGYYARLFIFLGCGIADDSRAV